MKKYFVAFAALGLMCLQGMAAKDSLYAADERPFILVDSWKDADYSVTASFTTAKPQSFRHKETVFFKRNMRVVPDPRLKHGFRSFSQTRACGSKYWMTYNFLFAARPIGNVVRVTGRAGVKGTETIVVPSFEAVIIVPWNALTHSEIINGIEYSVVVRWK